VSWHVYALSNPADGAIRYVGKSTNPAKRLASHCSSSAADCVRAWVQSLGCDPKLDVLATTSSETDALLLEQGWVERLRAGGADLLNIAYRVDFPRGKHAARFRGIGPRVLSARKTAGFTQTDLSERAGLERGKLSRLENGKRTQITAETAVVIARALDVSVEWLVTGEERQPNTRTA
jgi:DNA-binding Xre family transcriptional regulator/predicted GIY-YIG superfamily endonuclease